MVQANFNINQLITFNKQNPELLKGTPIDIAINKIFNYIQSNIHNKGIEQTAKNIIDDLFGVKLKIIQASPDVIKKISSGIIDFIVDVYSAQKRFNSLANTIADSLEIINQLAIVLNQNIQHYAITQSDIKENIPISLKELYKVFFVFPLKEFEYCWSFINNALLFDAYMVMFNLLFDNSIKLNDNQIAELKKFIFKTAEEYGYYASLLGLYDIHKLSENQLTRNIKIRLAIYEVENRKNKTLSEAECEDVGLAELMKLVERNQKVSRKKIMSTLTKNFSKSKKEDYALGQVIEKGMKTKNVSKESIFKALRK